MYDKKREIFHALQAHTAYKTLNNLLAHSFLQQQIVSMLLAYVNKLLAHPKHMATNFYFCPKVANLERLYGKT